MSKVEDGGAAFPLHPGIAPDWHQSNGMSLRDWFAGQALVGILANPDISASGAASGVSPEEFRSDITRAAFRVADAMLRARPTEEPQR